MHLKTVCLMMLKLTKNKYDFNSVEINTKNKVAITEKNLIYRVKSLCSQWY